MLKKTGRNYIGIEIEEDYVELVRNELKKEYKHFNSYFKELTRIPMNFSDKKQTVEYLHNHRKWFLEKYHSNLIPEFEKNIVESYGKDIYSAYLNALK